jgi:hypothetical protein
VNFGADQFVVEVGFAAKEGVGVGLTTAQQRCNHAFQEQRLSTVRGAEQ